MWNNIVTYSDITFGGLKVENESDITNFLLKTKKEISFLWNSYKYTQIEEEEPCV
jgi:hypothetical protein